MLTVLYNLLSCKIEPQTKQEIKQTLQLEDESFDGENEKIEIEKSVNLDEEEILRCKFDKLLDQYQEIVKKVSEQNEFLKKCNFFNIICNVDGKDLVCLSRDACEEEDLVNFGKNVILNLGIAQPKKKSNIVGGEDVGQIYLLPFLFRSQDAHFSDDQILFSNGTQMKDINSLITKIILFFQFKPPVISLCYF